MTKKTLIAALAALVLWPSPASANGLNLNGLGSRAQGMGGAFVGIADDFSAVFWNPAGAAGFRQTTYGFFATDLMPKGTFDMSIRPDVFYVPEYPPPTVDAKTRKASYLGFLGAYYKPIGSRVVVGLGLGTPSGLGTKWNGADFVMLSGGTAYDWSSKIQVLSVSPLVAVKISDRISAGAAVNIQYGNVNLKRPGGSFDLGEGDVDLGQYEENMNGWGIGATFGVLVKPIDKLRVGLTVRTPSTLTFEGSARMSYLSLYDLPDTSRLESKITWPLWIAGGVAFRPVPRLLLSADVQWTQWSRLGRIATNYLDPEWRSVFAQGSLLNVQTLDWSDKTQLRFGAEFQVDAATAIRAGYYNDPAPGPVSTLNVLLPTFTYNTFCVGVGKTLGGLQLDFGLEYLAGADRTLRTEVHDIAYGMHIVVPTASVSYRF